MAAHVPTIVSSLLLVSAVHVVTANAAAAGTDPVSQESSCVAVVLPSAKGVDGDATAFSTSLRDLFVR